MVQGKGQDTFFIYMGQVLIEKTPRSPLQLHWRLRHESGDRERVGLFPCSSPPLGQFHGISIIKAAWWLLISGSPTAVASLFFFGIVLAVLGFYRTYKLI